jgi:hypothetical protein
MHASRHNPADGPLLSCGCSFRDGEADPRFPCRNAARLLASREFARLLITGTPRDLGLQRALKVAEAALAAHYRGEVRQEDAAA